MREQSSVPADRAVAGLLSSLDVPGAGDVVRRERIAVGGWVTHRRRDVEAVLVAVDGQVRAGGPVDLERADVGHAHPDHRGSSTSGWTVEVDVHDVEGDTVHIEVFAVLAPKDGETPAVGRSVRFASRTLPLTDVYDGYFLERDEVPAGPIHVVGLAEAPGGVSTVELFCDDEPVGRARTCLPGRFPNVDQGPESSVAMFQASVLVPDDRDKVTFTGRVTPSSGAPFELRPWTAGVLPTRPDPVSADRLALVRERSLTSARDTPLRPEGGHAGRHPGQLRVLVATHDLGLGGGQLYLQELLKRLAPRGIEACVVSPRGGRLVAELEDLGIPVMVTGPTDAHDAEAYEAQVRQIMAFSVQQGCKVALANTMSAYAGVDAAQRLGLGVVWAIHESFPFRQYWGEAYHPPYPAYAASRAHAALGETRRAVFEAAATRDLYAPHLGEGVGVVVHYGVDFGEIDEYRARVDRDRLREELGFGPDTVVMLCIGTMEPRKAQVNIAQAFASSAALRGEDVQLVFVGGRDDPYTDAVVDLVELYDDRRVRIEPVQSDTYRWYHATDVLVCGSDVESLPRSMLEVMAFERPVASTDVFGIPDLVDEGVDGFLCRSRDQLALRGMLERVAATPRAGLAEMGVRARRKVLERHDPEIYTRYFDAELRAVAAVPAGGGSS